MSVKIVVARYKEDITWTKEFSNIVIYNKGDDDIDEYNPIKLPNVGREGHTFYTHIYNNYENLDDYTVFLQGNPFDHYKNIIEDLKSLTESPLDFMSLSDNIEYYSILNGCSKHPGLLGLLSLPLYTTYEKLFPDKDVPTKSLYFGPGGQFIVSKERILSYPREFYQNVISLLDYSVNPIEGFVMERFHSLFFSD